MEAKSNWMKNPTRKQVTLVVAAWLVAEFLTLAAATDLFRENPYRNAANPLNDLNLVTTVIVLVAVVNYFRNKKIKNRIS